MELILLLLVLVILVIGSKAVELASRLGSAELKIDQLASGQLVDEAKVDHLANRQRAAEGKINQLEVSLARARAEIAELTARPGDVTPAPATAPLPQVAPPIERAAPPAAERAARAAERAAPGERARVGSSARWLAEAEVEREPRQYWTAPPPIEREPAGPGLMRRLLDKLGFAPTVDGEGPSRASLEAWLEGRLLAVVGGVALLLGAVFFLSLAFSRGWITEEMRVLIGLVAGAGLLVLGELSFTRLHGIVGHVLVAIGLAIVSLALLAATRLYGLVAVEWGLAGAFVAATAAAAIAVRHDSQLVAAFGLIAVLASPPVLGASPTLVTLMFVAATLVGTTGVALFRTWTWLPPLAFVLAGPQLASYVSGAPPAVEGLIAVAGFWLVNIIAAGGEETRHRTDRLRTTTVTLLLADAAFTVWAGFTILHGGLEPWRGTFLAVLAAMHLALGLFFLVRYGDRHPFGLVVAATGVAALTMAAPVQAGGPPVPIAWAAEAVALAWVAVLRRHPYSAGVSALLGVMALGHLVSVEYPPADLIGSVARSTPFVGPEGMTFAFMVAGLVVTGLIVPIAWVRAGLAGIGGLVAVYVFPFELSDTALVAGWAALATAGVVLYVRVVAPRIRSDFREDRVAALALPNLVASPVSQAIGALSAAVRPLFAATAVIAGIAALGHLASMDYPLNLIGTGTPHAIPFVGLPGLSFAIVLVGLVVAGVLVPVPWIRVGLAAVGGLVATYVFPFELSGPSLVWAWAALGTGAFFVEARVIEPRVGTAFSGPRPARYVRPCVRGVGALAGFAVFAHLVVFDFPLVDLGRRTLSAFPYLGQEGLSLAAALAALTATGWVLGSRWIRLATMGMGMILLVYTVSFEVAQPDVTVAWGLLALVSLAVVRRITLVGPFALDRHSPLESVAERLPYAAAALALLFLVVRSFWIADVLAFGRHLSGSLRLAGSPFLDERTYVLAVLAATILLCGWTWGAGMPRFRGAVGAALVIAWLLPFEVRPGYAVAGWSALALAGLWAIRIVPPARLLMGATSLALLGFGAVVALAIVAPPDRLIVDASTTVLGWALVSDATVALGSLAIALGAGAFLHRVERLSLPAFIAAGVVVVYLLSVGVVDTFQRQIAIRPLEDLQKEGQVGLSVLWSVLGGAVFAAGLVTRRPPVRLFGLGLLGLATAKVFVADLAALDVAYRVLSLVALGVLLLISAVVYSRMQHPHGPVSPGPV